MDDTVVKEITTVLEQHRASLKVQFRVSPSSDDELDTEIIARTHDVGKSDTGINGSGVTKIAKTSLLRYFRMLHVSLPKFSLDEAVFLTLAVGGYNFDASTIHLLWAVVSDAVEQGLHKHIKDDYEKPLDGDALINRLRQLGKSNPFACLAILDAVEKARTSDSPSLSDGEWGWFKETLISKGLPAERMGPLYWAAMYGFNFPMPDEEGIDYEIYDEMLKSKYGTMEELFESEDGPVAKTATE